MLNFELALKLLRSKNAKSLSVAGWISLLGLVLGVACLMVSMAVMSGFEKTLQKNVSDVSGDIQILFPPRGMFDSEEKLIKGVDGLKNSMGFLISEGLLAVKGRVRGAILQGVNTSELEGVLRIQNRLIEGTVSDFVSDKESVLVGKGIAREHSLKIGDEIQVVILLGAEVDSGKFKRKIGRFKVAGILDLGKYEYDQKMVIVQIGNLQNLLEVGNKVSGYILRLNTPDQALVSAPVLQASLGGQYRVRTWKDVNENIFEAVKIEKVIVFFVILVIVIAASFNVMSSLFINVFQRFNDIAILKALGMNSKQVLFIFNLQGLIIGGAGCILGLLFGGVLCYGFQHSQKILGLIPESVYKIDSIDLTYRFVDILAIIFATLFVCLLATWAPARHGVRLRPVEGLRYD